MAKRPPSKRNVSEAERQLWLALNRGENITTSAIITPQVTTKVTDEKSSAATAKQQAFLSRTTLRRFGKSSVPSNNTLDLHGLTAEAAQIRLTQFLQNRARNGVRRVLVITGKGKQGMGILRQQLPMWLETPALQNIVTSYRAATRQHGGSGAYYVFLRHA